jgi:GR25 family glycosyltransferase involved in LPS biosynthesis
MPLSHPCSKKMRRSIVFIFFSIILFVINSPFDVKDHSILYQIQPFNRSLLFHINGSRKYLGKASPIYIINLPSRYDRLTESIALIQTFNLEAIIVPAYSIHSPVILRHNQKLNRLFFKLTELACWASHMRLWLTIVNYTSSDNNTWSLVFEDDIDLEIDTPYIMQTFPHRIWNDADLIYLGHCANPPGKLIYQSSKHVYRIHQALHPSCTHAYAIRSNTAKKLAHLLSKPSRPIDDSIVKLVDKHQLIAYSIHPPLAIQKPVSKTNPSDVNLINRQSFIYSIQFGIYTFLQWWNGVEPYETLNKSALKRANLTNAEYWRKIYEKGIWKNYT